MLPFNIISFILAMVVATGCSTSQQKPKEPVTLRILSYNIRHGEGMEVQVLIDALKDRDHPVILAGDFNGERSDPSLKLLEKDGWTILKKDDPIATLTCPSDKPRVEIDFFIVKGIDLISVEHTVIDERVASDHRPITATIKFSAL